MVASNPRTTTAAIPSTMTDLAPTNTNTTIDSNPASSTADFAHLSPRVRHISQTTIRKKWRPLPQSSQDRIRTILLSLKNKRVGAKDRGRVPAVTGRVKSRAGRNSRNVTSRRDALDEEYERAVEMVAEK